MSLSIKIVPHISFCSFRLLWFQAISGKGDEAWEIPLVISKVGKNVNIYNTETHPFQEDGSFHDVHQFIWKYPWKVNLYLKDLWNETYARSPSGSLLPAKVLLMHYQLYVPHD